MIRSFSGRHAFKPTCLIPALAADGAFPEHRESLATIAAMIARQIDKGQCPRCWQALPDGNPIKPAGSRVTACRCIPICGPCGSHEGNGAEFVVGPLYWTIQPVDGVHERHALETALATGAVIGSGGVVIDESGAFTPTLRPHPGGWAEFGHDEEEDQ